MLDVEHNRLTSLPLCLGQRSGLCVLRLGHNSLQQLDFLLPSNRHVGAGIARGGIAGGDFDSSTMGLLKLHTLEAQCNELTEVSVITRTLAHSHAHKQMSLSFSLSLCLSVRVCVCVCCIHVCMYLYINEMYVDGELMDVPAGLQDAARIFLCTFQRVRLCVPAQTYEHA